MLVNFCLGQQCLCPLFSSWSCGAACAKHESQRAHGCQTRCFNVPIAYTSYVSLGIVLEGGLALEGTEVIRVSVERCPVSGCLIFYGLSTNRVFEA